MGRLSSRLSLRRELRIRSALAGSLALWVVWSAACGGSSGASTPTQQPAATPAPTTTTTQASPAPPSATPTQAPDLYTIAPDVPARDQDVIRAAVTAARYFVTERRIAVPNSQVLVQASWGPDNPVCFTGGSLRVIVNVNCPVFQSGSDAMKSKQTAYAYFRVVQLFLARTGDPSRLGPNWLFAGSAQYFGGQVLVAQGLATDANAAACEEWSYLNGPSRPALEATNPSSDGSVALAAVAVRNLVGGNDISKVLAYYGSFGASPSGSPVDWQVAFKDAFGKTPSDFYREFAAYRETLKTLTTPNPCP